MTPLLICRHRHKRHPAIWHGFNPQGERFGVDDDSAGEGGHKPDGRGGYGIAGVCPGDQDGYVPAGRVKVELVGYPLIRANGHGIAYYVESRASVV